MSVKKEKAKRKAKQKKDARKFARELDSTQIKIWLKYKQANPHVKCNAEFQAKVSALQKLIPDINLKL